MDGDICVHELTKEYDTSSGLVRAVDRLSFTVKKGGVFGFLGPNGAGKTTTMKMLVGLASPTSGTITVAGGSPSDIDVRARIGYMPESPSFYLYLSGEEFLRFIAEIFELNDAEKRIAEVIRMVNLAGAEKRQVRTYSKGMLQRLGLAQAILNDPDILFLDEPLDGLDPLGRAEIKKIFFGLRKSGKTIFFNSHILSDVEEVCDTVGIVDQGSLIAVDTPAALSKGYRDLEDAFVDIIVKERAKVPVV